MEKKWEEMSSDEKQEELFQRWLSPQGIEFASPEAEKSYQERATRIKDAIQLKKLPDRVPVFPAPGFFPAFYAGMTPQEVMYDYDKCYAAWKKFVLDFEPDARGGCGGPGPGKFFDILDYKLYAWPGHGVSPEHSYQCLEGEYMKADEYDALIQDPSHFFRSTYLPRIFGALEPFNKLPPLTSILEIFGVASNFIPYGLPDVQAAYKALLEAGNEAKKWGRVVAAFNQEMAELGFPSGGGGFTKAPYDVIGDTLRGTRGIMLDMYRQPDKLLQALEAITPLLIKMGVPPAKGGRNPLVMIPLHKGADGFLSDEQFKTFYWPTFRKLLMGLIDEGCVPFPAAEGGYNSRLEVIRDLPKGKTMWLFDQTDMAKAKEILGDTACISGNMPIALLTVGTPQQVKDYAKKLIDTVGKGGGYIMANGAFFNKAKPENVKAMVDFTKEYGVYK
jgi:uroporphyrinogen-III decarboxylase